MKPTDEYQDHPLSEQPPNPYRRRKKTKKNIVPDEMENQEVQFTLEVVKENPDGSADCEMRCNPYTSAKLIEIALISLLKKHVEQEKLKTKAWWKIW
jgi:hypothetical protein